MELDVDETDRFDAAVRRWATGAAATPPDAAARAVVERLRAGPPGRRAVLRRALAVAAIAVTVGGAWLFWLRETRSAGPATVAVPRAVVPNRNADLVVWLDDGTPVTVFLPGSD